MQVRLRERVQQLVGDGNVRIILVRSLTDKGARITLIFPSWTGCPEGRVVAVSTRLVVMVSVAAARRGNPKKHPPASGSSSRSWSPWWVTPFAWFWFLINPGVIALWRGSCATPSLRHRIRAGGLRPGWSRGRVGTLVDYLLRPYMHLWVGRRRLGRVDEAGQDLLHPDARPKKRTTSLRFHALAVAVLDGPHSEAGVLHARAGPQAAHPGRRLPDYGLEAGSYRESRHLVGAGSGASSGIGDAGRSRA